MTRYPLAGTAADETGLIWTPDLTIAASLLGAAALVIAGAWVIVGLRARAVRTAGTEPAMQLAHTATLNRNATALTGIALASVVIVFAWRLLLHLG